MDTHEEGEEQEALGVSFLVARPVVEVVQGLLRSPISQFGDAALVLSVFCGKVRPAPAIVIRLVRAIGKLSARLPEFLGTTEIEIRI